MVLKSGVQGQDVFRAIPSGDSATAHGRVSAVTLGKRETALLFSMDAAALVLSK